MLDLGGHQLSAAQGGKFVRLAFEKGGNGIEIADLHHFQRFFRLREQAAVQSHGILGIVIGAIGYGVGRQTRLVGWISAEISGFAVDSEGGSGDTIQLPKTVEGSGGKFHGGIDDDSSEGDGAVGYGAGEETHCDGIVAVGPPVGAENEWFHFFLLFWGI